MYELSFWIEDYKEDSSRFETLEEAMREFGNWIEEFAKELRKDVGSAPRTPKPTPIATIKIQKMEDVISVDI